MKTFNLLGFVLLTLSACAAPGSSTAGPSYKVTDNMAAISVTAGDRFTLKMTENSGTGFQWTPDFDDAQISLIDKSYSGGDPKTDGGAETVSFVFKGLAPGQTEIAFHLARAGDTTIETRTVSVTVTEEN
jgi:predicted secreted protein